MYLHVLNIPIYYHDVLGGHTWPFLTSKMYYNCVLYCIVLYCLKRCLNFAALSFNCSIRIGRLCSFVLFLKKLNLRIYRSVVIIYKNTQSDRSDRASRFLDIEAFRSFTTWCPRWLTRGWTRGKGRYCRIPPNSPSFKRLVRNYFYNILQLIIRAACSKITIQF